MGSQQQTAATTSRFMTAKQLEKSGKLARKTKSRALKEVKLFAIPNKSESKTSSTLLEGYIFNVLPGNYRLDNDPFASSEAEEGGWKMGATEVTSHTDVIRYIQSHGGTVELTAHLGCVSFETCVSIRTRRVEIIFQGPTNDLQKSIVQNISLLIAHITAQTSLSEDEEPTRRCRLSSTSCQRPIRMALRRERNSPVDF